MPLPLLFVLVCRLLRRSVCSCISQEAVLLCLCRTVTCFLYLQGLGSCSGVAEHSGMWDVILCWWVSSSWWLTEHQEQLPDTVWRSRRISSFPVLDSWMARYSISPAYRTKGKMFKLSVSWASVCTSQRTQCLRCVCKCICLSSKVCVIFVQF